MNERRFIEATWEAIQTLRIVDRQEPERLRVSSDWGVEGKKTTVWGLPVIVKDDLPPETIKADPMCQHDWGGPFVSKIEWGEPDATGVRWGRLLPAQKGTRCVRCGLTAEDIA